MTKTKKPKPRRRGSITLTPTGGYQARIRLPRDLLTGERPGISKVLPTMEEAETWLSEELARMDSGERLRAENKGQTLRAWLDEFYTTFKAGKKGKKLGPRTVQTDLSFLKTYVFDVSPELADTTLTRVTAELIAKHFARLAREKPELAAATVSRVFRILKARLAFAVKLGKIRRNPADSETITIDGKAPREHRTLSFEQTRALLDVCEDQKHGEFIATLLWSGVRPGEAAGLTWPDVDFEHGSLAIRRALVRVRPTEQQRGSGDSWTLETTKTKKSRTVKIPAELVEVLQRHKRAQAALRLAAGAEYENNGLCFCTDFGRPLTLNSLVPRYLHPLIRTAALGLAGEEPLPLGKPSRSAAYKARVAARRDQEERALASTNFPLLSLYECRHSLATLLLRKGVHPKIVADRLGHAKVGTTLDQYSHVTPDMQEAAVDALTTGLERKKGA